MHDDIPPRRRRRWVRALAALGVALAAVLALQAWSLPEYALTPGDARPVGPLVSIHGLSATPHRTHILLTDVYLQSLTAWQWLILHFQAHVQFVSAADLVDPGVPASELGAQGYLEMYDSKQAAAVAALRALGWRVPAAGDGAVVTAVTSSSPAQRARLAVGDRIVAVGGRAVRSGCALVRAVHDVAPGTRLRVEVAPVRISGTGQLRWRASRTLRLVTAAAPAGLLAPTCAGVTGAARSWLGLAVEDGVAYRLPGTIAVDTRSIGGPSAGLAMCLAIIDALSRQPITGRAVVAATGTIAPGGQVGDVGGVAEKTIAVERAGASVFLVPQVEVATARAAASPGLRVVGVTTLAQALAALHQLGGAKPQPRQAPTAS